MYDCVLMFCIMAISNLQIPHKESVSFNMQKDSCGAREQAARPKCKLLTSDSWIKTGHKKDMKLN